MKKTLAFFTLLLGLMALFAQSGPTFPYQAVVRNSHNQLIKDSTFAIGVEVYQSADLKFSETQSVTTNANGQFTMNIGGGASVSGAMTDVADWSVAKFQITYHLSEGDIVSENAVNPVPYALQAANATSAASGNFLTSDSATITTMQTNIATNADDIAALANRVNTFNTNVCDSVKDCYFSGNASIQNMLQELSDLISAQNHKIDSLAQIVDSLSNLPHGGGGTPTVADGQPCPGTATVSDVDGNTYNTVKIGNQCWMKENLRTKTHQYGTVWTKTDVDSTIYGRYYDWQAAMQIDVDNNTLYSGSDVKHQGICPEGWHVPSYEEWDTLTTYVNTEANGYRCDGDGTIAKALSRPTGWSSNTGTGCNAGNTGDKANATGFAAVPAGYCFFGDFYSFGYYAYFWSATQDDGYNAGYWRLRSDNSFVASGNGGKDYGFSVRCLRDAETGGGDTPSTPGTVSCEQVMECIGDTLGQLNAKIEAQGAEIATLSTTVTEQGNTITAQGQTIETLNSTVESQGNTIDSLAHLVDSLSNLTPGGGETAIVDTVFCYPNLGANTPNTNTVTRGENFNLSSVTFTHPVETNNWEIASWNTKADGSGTRYERNATITTSDNLTLYAQWRTFCTGTPSSANEVGSGRIDSLKDVENNKYAVVQIGNQCWMKENLRTTTKRNGVGNIYTNNTQAGYNAETYGYYYNWAAVMQGASSSDAVPSGVQGICPTGWHVPSNAEWTTMTDYVKSQSEYVCPGCSGTDDERMTFCIAKALSSTTGWNSNTREDCKAGNRGDKANATGFSAVPAAPCYNGDFIGFGYHTYFWSATHSGGNAARYRYLDSDASSVNSGNADKGNGYSVRCVRD